MDWKGLAGKIDVAMILGLVVGVLYLWGFVYWSNYYHHFGLPFEFGGLGFERLALAGSWYLWLFASRAAVGVLIAAAAVALVRHVSRRFAPDWSGRVRDGAAAVKTKLSTAWVVIPAVALLVCAGYDWTLDFIRRDAKHDALTRIDNPGNTVTLQVKGKLDITGHDSFELLELRGGSYYLLRRRPDRVPELVVVREAEVETMTVRVVAAR